MTTIRLRPIDADGTRGARAAAGAPADPPAVLIGSALARAEVYRPTVEQLARRHRAHLVQLPGSGRAQPLPEPWELTDYARWVAAALGALDVRGATLIGHSHGAAVALLVAARHPERVGRLVIADGVGGSPAPLWRVFLGAARDCATVEFPLAAREWHRVAFCAGAHPRNFARQVRLSLDADLAADATRVRVPALLAWGARDHTTPPAGARALARHLPDPTVYFAPRGGHSWLITHAREFADAVAGWVRGAPRSV